MKKGDIWIVDFPTKGGREQKGLRPSLVIADTETSLAVVCCYTFNIKSLSF